MTGIQQADNRPSGRGKNIIGIIYYMKYSTPYVRVPGYKWNRKKSLPKTHFKAMVASTLTAFNQMIVLVIIIEATQPRNF
jgi:hypothetical protein